MTTVRSVSAHLDADVNAYIRDMRRAGRETDQAFNSMATSVRNTNRELGITDIRTQKAVASTTQLDNKLSQLPGRLNQTSTGVRRLGNDLSALDKRLGTADTRLSTLATNGVRAGDGLNKLGAGARNNRAEIDDLSGRVRILLDALTILGPAAIPIATLAVPALAGLSNQLGFAAAAGGVALLAFQGVGDAMTAMNEYAVTPTAANMAKVEEALAKLSPQAREFATELGGMRDTLLATRDAAAEGLFSELTPSLDDLDGLLGRLQPILREIGAAAGDMLADGLESLNSDRWEEFFNFLEAEARPTLTDLGHITGDFAHGLANMWMAFQPLNRDFSSWLADVADSFDGWADGLAQTDGFNEFMSYLSTNGPRVADTLGALGGALLDIGIAAAPFAGPTLAALEAVANVVSAIADSPAGPALVGLASAMALFNRAMAVQQKVAQGGFFATTRANLDRVKGLGTSLTGTAASATRAVPTLGQFGTVAMRAGQSSKYASTQTLAARDAVRGFAANAARGAAGVAGLTLATTGLGDKLGVANTATFALMGSMAGPWGTAIGGAVGGVMDLAAANDDFVLSAERVDQVMRSGTLQEKEAEYTRLKAQLDDTRYTFGRFMGDLVGEATGSPTFANLESDLARLGDEIRRTEDPATGLAGVLTNGLGNVTSEGVRVAAADVEQLRMSLTRLNEALTGSQSWIDYERALDAANDAVKENGKNLDITTEKGRVNREALNDIAATSIAVAENLQGMNRVRFLQRARSDFVAAAQDMGMTRGEARQLARQLGFLDNLVVKPKVENPDNLPAFKGNVDRLRTSLDSMPEDVRTRMDITGVPQTRSEITALQRAYDLTPQQVRTLVTLMHQGALRGIRNVDDLLRALDGSRANPTVDVNARAAEAAIAGVRAGLASINGRNTSSSHTHTTFYKQVGVAAAGAARLGASVLGNAEGGYYDTVRAYAGGGYQPRRDPGDRANGHAPQIARPGRVWRVWGEEETEGEVYAPLADDYRRPRAKQIIEQTVDHFGGQVEWYAEGGVRAGRRRDADDRARDARERAREAKEKARDAREDAREKARERRQNIRQAARDFNPDRDDTAGQVSKALRILERDVRRAGGAWTKTMDRHGSQLVAATARYRKLSKAIDDNRDDLRDLRQDAASYRADVRNSFNNDIFGNGLAGLKTQLEADRNDTRAMDAALDQAVRRGLSGGLEKALRASGDLTTAQQLSRLSAADIARYERLYNERATAQNVFAKDSGERIFGASIRAYERLIAKQTRSLDKIDRNLNRWEKSIRRDVRDGVKQGAAAGIRAGMSDRNVKATITAKTRRR